MRRGPLLVEKEPALQTVTAARSAEAAETREPVRSAHGALASLALATLLPSLGISAAKPR
jgi:hypothetical protein